MVESKPVKQGVSRTVILHRGSFRLASFYTVAFTQGGSKFSICAKTQPWILHWTAACLNGAMRLLLRNTSEEEYKEVYLDTCQTTVAMRAMRTTSTLQKVYLALKQQI